MATFFEKNKLNFQDVSIVEGKVDTAQFLDASKDLVGLFGKYLFARHEENTITSGGRHGQGGHLIFDIEHTTRPEIDPRSASTRQEHCQLPDHAI